MRKDVLKTIYNIIEHTSDEINELLENHNIGIQKNLHILSEHIDNLKDSLYMLEKIGEEDLYMKLRSECMDHQMIMDKPIIMKKTSISVEKQ